MDAIWREMYEAARRVQNHREISKYVEAGGVAAAVLSESGRIYTGVCVDTACTLGVCAERNAIFHAIAEGERRLLAVAIVGGTDGERKEYCVPCGACRQVMRDFGDKDTMIVLSARTPDDYRENTLDELLPYSFGPESL